MKRANGSPASSSAAVCRAGQGGNGGARRPAFDRDQTSTCMFRLRWRTLRRTLPNSSWGWQERRASSSQGPASSRRTARRRGQVPRTRVRGGYETRAYRDGSRSSSRSWLDNSQGTVEEIAAAPKLPAQRSSGGGPATTLRRQPPGRARPGQRRLPGEHRRRAASAPRAWRVQPDRRVHEFGACSGLADEYGPSRRRLPGGPGQARRGGGEAPRGRAQEEHRPTCAWARGSRELRRRSPLALRPHPRRLARQR